MSKRDKKEENDKFSIYILLRFVCSWHFEVKRRVKWLGSLEMAEQPPQPRRVSLLGQLCDCASTLLMVSMSNISRDAFGTLTFVLREAKNPNCLFGTQNIFTSRTSKNNNWKMQSGWCMEKCISQVPIHNKHIASYH